MAYWIDSSTSYTGMGYPVQRDFYCDTSADINDLPTSTHEGVQQGNDTVSCKPVSKGSSCLCIGSSSLYVLNSQDKWVEM